MFAVIFICGNIFLLIAGKTAKMAQIRTRKNFVPHGSWTKRTNSTHSKTLIMCAFSIES